ncbi:MAG: AMP-binding protein, partial [Planctomycetes bacterium]|nr:AMP-binding protein [Planctomycetota bacterium]
MLDKLPMTPNGKIDRKALPEPDLDIQAEQQYPRTETEHLLCNLWSKVLGREVASTKTNFFESGGHSLLATQLVSRIREHFKNEMPLRIVFEKPILREQAEWMDKQHHGTEVPPIKPLAEGEPLVLSFAQQRLWFLAQLEGQSATYNIPAALRIEGELDVFALQRSLTFLIKRHESLRLSFPEIDGEVTVERNDVYDPLNVTDLSELRVTDQQRQVAKWVSDDAEAPFDLATGPLLRLRLIKINKEEQVMLFNMHHIISDGWSEGVLIRELSHLYNAYSQNIEQQLPELRIQYTDYAAWQRKWLQGEILEQQLDYWIGKLNGVPELLELPTDYPRPAVMSYRGKHLQSALSPELTQGIKKVSSQYGVTHFMFLLSAFKVLLYRYSGQRDLVVGTPIANRTQHQTEDLIGFFVNTLVLHTHISGGETFTELLKQVRQTSLDANSNQDIPFEYLVDQINPARSLSHSPLFQVVFTLQNIPREKLVLNGLKLSMIESESRTAKFDLALSITERGDVFFCNWEYNSDLFNPDTIVRMTEHFIVLLKGIVNNPDQTLCRLPLLTEDEHQLLQIWNQTCTHYPEDRTIIDLFQDQVVKTPDNVAVVFKEQQISYSQLNKKANQLAHYLMSLGVKTETLVGICVERSLEMVTGLLAILKAGGAYVPLDPDNPQERLRFMLDDTKTPVLLAQKNTLDFYQYTRLQIIASDSVHPHVTRARTQINEFESIPVPDRSLIDYEQYHRYIGLAAAKHSITVQATRGCPYNCSYCHEIFSKKHVCRSAQHLFDELSVFYDMGIKRFVFVDDIFNIDRENSSRFFELLIENSFDVQLHFPNGMRGDILTKDYIDLMVKAGTVSLSLALETASPRLQKLIRKNLKLEKLRENIQYISQTYPQVILDIFFMHGFPTETREEAVMTLDFVKSIKWLHFPYFQILKIFPNTDMEKIALGSGVSQVAIDNSTGFAYHELPETLPFDKAFTLQCQSEFMEYFLSRERLLHVLPFQMNVMTEDEIVQKYNSYLPVAFNSFSDLLEFVDIDVASTDGKECLSESSVSVNDFNQKLRRHFTKRDSEQKALRVLLLDLSQFFSVDSDRMLYDVVEAPLGLMYIMTSLYEQFGERVCGKIAKSRIDFDSYHELKKLLTEFQPDVIGIRTLTFYKDFFHKTVTLIKHWVMNVPVIAGGPYATSDYAGILQDPHVDLAVLGEGEVIFGEVIGKIIENGGKLPGKDVLQEIPGIAFTQNEEGPQSVRKIVFMDELSHVLSKMPVTNPVPFSEVKPENPAYVIYTSGSTGSPKGASVYHKGVTNLVNWFVKALNLTDDDSTLIISPFSFDLTQKNFFAPLILGGKLHILPSEFYDPENITRLISEKSITWVNCAPSAFYPLTEPGDDNTFRKLSPLRYAVLGGEPVSLSRLMPWLQDRSCQARIMNSYGPTESTDVCVAYLLDTPELDKTVPIGRPIHNVRINILDENLGIVPIGVVGELYIGGECLGAGYVNDIELTQSRFIPDPFNKDSHLYKTGDLGRWLPDGNIEFSGRLDNQVKLRGFRIELSEIEVHLIQYEVVKEAVVTVYGKENNPCLRAYVTLTMPVDEVSGMLRTWLQNRLPEYMIPASFTVLDKLPLTPNGKIDRKGLPAPDLHIQAEHQYPRTETEQLLCSLWSKVLSIEVTGKMTNFFESGGHSLLATQLVSRIRESFGIEMPIRVVFEQTVLQDQAQWLDKQHHGTAVPPIKTLAEGEPLVLSFAQQRLWFLAQLEGQSATYNIPAALRIEGELDVIALQRSLTALIKRHESLRLGFPMVDGAATVERNCVFDPLSVTDLSELRDPEQQSQVAKWIVDHAQIPFELSMGYLLDLRLIKLNKEEQILLINMHHIISDGWSIGVLIREWSQLYNAYVQNQEPQLPELPIQYTDYAAWQRSWLQGEILDQQLGYWIEKLDGIPDLIELPTDFPRPGVMGYRGAHLQRTLSLELTKGIKQLSRQHDVTCFMTLLSAFNVLLYRYSGQTDLVVGSPVANRIQHQTEDLIGYFVNTLVLRTNINAEHTFSELLKQVRETSLNAYAHQEIPFEYLVEQINPLRSLSHSPLFQVMFVLQNTSQEALELKGLRMSIIEAENRTAKFDLTLSVAEHGDVFVCDWEYNTALFHPETIARMTEHFETLSGGIINYPEQTLFKLPLLTETEQVQLLAWNKTVEHYPEVLTIVDLFEAQVEETPDNTALVFENQQLSYRELNRKANQLAHYLINLGAGDGNGPLITGGSLVGICVERSLEMVVGLLGILKAGGAYVPIDPGYPLSRLQFMIDDSESSLLLTQRHLLERLQLSDTKVVCLDNEWQQIEACSYENLKIQNGPESLAYVIYTSGSTGKSKGC